MATISIKCKQCKKYFNPHKKQYKVNKNGVICEDCLKKPEKKS